MSSQSAAAQQHGYITEKEQYLQRMKRIEGQARGIAKMIDEEKYCIDILTQISALTRAIQGVATGLLDDHLKHCVLDAAKLGDDAAALAKIQEATDAINRLVPADGSDEEPPQPAWALEAATQHLLDLADQLGVDLPRIALQTWAEAARDPEIHAVMAPEARRIRAAWRNYAEHAIAAGALRKDADPEKVAMVLTGLLPGFILQRIMLGDVTPKTYAAGLTDLLG